MKECEYCWREYEGDPVVVLAFNDEPVCCCTEACANLLRGAPEDPADDIQKLSSAERQWVNDEADKVYRDVFVRFDGAMIGLRNCTETIDGELAGKIAHEARAAVKQALTRFLCKA